MGCRRYLIRIFAVYGFHRRPHAGSSQNKAVSILEYWIAGICNRMAANSLDEIRKEKMPADVSFRTSVVQGRPADEIVKLAEPEKADLIVISSHGESGWHRFMFGSVAEKVVRSAECPVLTIRAPN